MYYEEPVLARFPNAEASEMALNLGTFAAFAGDSGFTANTHMTVHNCL